MKFIYSILGGLSAILLVSLVLACVIAIAIVNPVWILVKGGN